MNEETDMKKEVMESRRFWLGVAMILVGTVLTFMGFFTPPVGEIHGSILGAVGEFLTLGGALVGVSAYVDYKIRRTFHRNHIDKIENIENEDIEQSDYNEVG